jgi:ribosome biogenesis GTPase
MKDKHNPRPTSNTTGAQEGIVYKKVLGSYTVRSGGREIACTLSASLRKTLEATPDELRHKRRPGRQVGNGGRARQTEDDRQRTDPIVVGDQVSFLELPGGGQILEILPRRTYLSRRSPVPMPSARPYEQVIVANIDQVVPVFAAADPEPKWSMLDRYLVSAEAAGLPAAILITKLDLARGEDGSLDEAISAAVDEYRRIGYPVLLASSLNGEGLDQVKEALAGRTSVLLGKSGVGKTSLLNAIQPGLGLRVNAVSQVTGKGKHTTTHLEMFPLEFGEAGIGGAIVDTPGVREFGLWEIDEADLALYFPEMRPLVGRCRFGLDCQHDEEPGCAIRKAVVGGQISPHRYQSYMRLKIDG